MHREALTQFSTSDRFSALRADAVEPPALEMLMDADAAPHDHDDLPAPDYQPRMPSRTAAARRVLTPAVERVLAWHQRRRA